jgi:hypothetical protein
MKLDSVRDLKFEFLTSHIAAFAAATHEIPGAAVLSRSTEGPNAFTPTPMIGLGVAPGAKAGDFRLALRLDDPALAEAPTVKALLRDARGEVDQRIVRRIYALAAMPWNCRRVRPLVSGLSVGHCKSTAGTIGAFIRLPGGDLRLLSNNHVLANVNRARRMDAILQPGPFDGGHRARDVAAHLDTYKRISFAKANRLDAAIASIGNGLHVEPGRLRGIGPIRGVADEEVMNGEDVAVTKLGRTTGVTKGKITAFELDGVRVSFGGGSVAVFDGQLEIESTTGEPFSRGGDSGSLVVTPAGWAVGLLFAGADTGGSKGLGLAYANPIQETLDAFGAHLAVV